MQLQQPLAAVHPTRHSMLADGVTSVRNSGGGAAVELSASVGLSGLWCSASAGHLYDSVSCLQAWKQRAFKLGGVAIACICTIALLQFFQHSSVQVTLCAVCSRNVGGMLCTLCVVETASASVGCVMLIGRQSAHPRWEQQPQVHAAYVLVLASCFFS